MERFQFWFKLGACVFIALVLAYELGVKPGEDANQVTEGKQLFCKILVLGGDC